MLKKIAYIELDTHAELAQNFMKLMSDSQNYEVDYYFSEKIINQLKISQGDNIFKVSVRNLLEVLSKRRYNFVMIGTVHRYFNVFEKVINHAPTYIITHNLNFSNISQPTLIQNIFKKDIAFRFKLLLKEGLLRAPKIYKKAKGLFVLDESFTNHRFKFLPLFFNEFNEKNPNDIFRIVIPGAVSQRRRDYRFILAELNKFSSSMEVIFLGKAEGKELSWLKSFNNPYINLVYFTEKIPQPIFDDWMKKADVLWCPIQKETEFFSQKEIYGLSKMTGNIGDAIKYGKPTLFPNGYQHYHFVIKQNDDIENILKTSKINFDFQKEFSKEKISKKMHKILDGLYCQ